MRQGAKRDSRARVGGARVSGNFEGSANPLRSALILDEGGEPEPHTDTMALPLEPNVDLQDPRALRILAKSIYRDLRENGLGERDVMALASELLGLVTTEVRGKAEPSQRD